MAKTHVKMVVNGAEVEGLVEPRTLLIHFIREQLLFPEIEYDKIDKIRGMDVVICTTAQTDEEARELLTLVGAPFER